MLDAEAGEAVYESVTLQDPDEEPEFELSDQDMLAEPEEAGEDVELEDLDPDDRNNRPRHWNVERPTTADAEDPLHPLAVQGNMMRRPSRRMACRPPRDRSCLPPPAAHLPYPGSSASSR